MQLALCLMLYFLKYLESVSRYINEYIVFIPAMLHTVRNTINRKNNTIISLAIVKLLNTVLTLMTGFSADLGSE